MKKAIVIGILCVVASVGCGSGKDQPVIPTELKQPPGMDSEGGRKGKPQARPEGPDTGKASASEG